MSGPQKLGKNANQPARRHIGIGLVGFGPARGGGYGTGLFTRNLSNLRKGFKDLLVSCVTHCGNSLGEKFAKISKAACLEEARIGVLGTPSPN